MGTAPPRPGRRRGVALGVVLAALAVLAAAACTRWPVPVGLVQRVAGERLQRTLTISEDATFCLCPRPTLTASTIELGPPAWSDAPHFVRLSDVEVRLGPATLLGARPHVVAASVGRGDVVLERHADGRASWDLPLPRERDGPSEPPRIDRLEVRELAWRLADRSLRADLSGTLSLVDGAVPARADERSQRPRLTLSAHGTLRGLPVDARVEGGGVLPRGDAGPRAVTARAKVGEGRLDFDGETRSLVSLDGLSGAFEASGPALASMGSLFGAVLPRSPPFRIEGRLHRAGERWELSIARATLGGSDLRGDVAFTPARGRTSARLDGTLESARMRIADLGRSVGFGEKQDPRRADRVLPDVSLDLPSLGDMDARLGLRVARLELGAGTAPISDLGVALRLENAVLALGELQANVAGGRLDGELRIDATDRPGRVHASLRIRQVALERWLPKLRGAPPIASRLNAELKLRGRGDSVADVLGHADGRARIALGPGEASRLLLEAAGLDIAEALAVLSTRDTAVHLDCGLADVAIERGTVTPQVMFIDTRDTLLTAQGRAHLGRERLELRIRAAPRDFSPLTVRSPIDVGGSFAEPRVSIDRTRVAGTVVASVVLGTLVTPIAALLPLLDFGEGDAPSPCTERYGRSQAPAAPPPPPSPSPAPSNRSAAR